MTSFERAERNQKIVTARLRGLSERHVAATFDISERHVRRVVQAYRESRPALHETDLVEALQDVLHAYQALIDEAVVLADEAQQESTKLGALKLRVALLDARIGLVPGLGLLPTKLERARLTGEFEHSIRQVLRVFDRHSVPEHVQRRSSTRSRADCRRGRSQATAKLLRRLQPRAMTLSSQWMRPLRSPVVSAPPSPATSLLLQSHGF